MQGLSPLAPGLYGLDSHITLLALAADRLFPPRTSLIPHSLSILYQINPSLYENTEVVFGFNFKFGVSIGVCFWSEVQSSL